MTSYYLTYYTNMNERGRSSYDQGRIKGGGHWDMSPLGAEGALPPHRRPRWVKDTDPWVGRALPTGRPEGNKVRPLGVVPH